jgi:hypothetical protein
MAGMNRDGHLTPKQYIMLTPFRFRDRLFVQYV